MAAMPLNKGCAADYIDKEAATYEAASSNQLLKLLAASREESPIPKRNPVFCSHSPPQAAGNALAEFN